MSISTTINVCLIWGKEHIDISDLGDVTTRFDKSRAPSSLHHHRCGTKINIYNALALSSCFNPHYFMIDCGIE